MLGVYNYTVILTYVGMLSAYTGVFFAIKGNSYVALFCLILAGLCDMFDGKVASTKKDRTVKERRFGIQIDSLSDLICFGVLPAVTVCQMASGDAVLHIVSLIVSGFYVLGGLIRLAWFNVDEEERQDETEGERKQYSGLPITSSALIVPAAMALCYVFKLSTGLFGTILLGLMAVAFVSPFKLSKPGNRGKIILILLGVVIVGLLVAGGFINGLFGKLV